MLNDWLENPIFGSAGGMRVRENAYLATLQRLGMIGLVILAVLGAFLSREMGRAFRNRKNLGPYGIFSDVAIAGIAAIAANSLVEATFFSNLNQTVFASYVYLVMLGCAAQMSATMQRQ